MAKATDNNLVFLNWNIFSLQLQPEGSFEKKIAEESKKSLVDLTAFVQTISQQL